MGTADLVGEALAVHHGLEVYCAAHAEEIAGIDDGFVFRCHFFFVDAAGAGGWFGRRHGGERRDVHAPACEGVLQHHQHRGVFLPRLGFVVGVIIRDVEIELDLAEVLVRRESVGENLVAKVWEVGVGLGEVVFGPFLKVGAGDAAGEW